MSLLSVCLYGSLLHAHADSYTWTLRNNVHFIKLTCTLTPPPQTHTQNMHHTVNQTDCKKVTVLSHTNKQSLPHILDTQAIAFSLMKIRNRNSLESMKAILCKMPYYSFIKLMCLPISNYKPPFLFLE